MPSLNLGSGVHYAESWVNVDPITPDPPSRPPDHLAGLPSLPFEDDFFEDAYLGHVLEHIPWDELEDHLAELRRVVRPGGIVMAVGPCLWKALDTGQPRGIVRAIVADPRHHDHPWGHSWTPTEELTVEAMRLGGFEAVEVHDVQFVGPPTWPNPNRSPWQVAVSGVVP